MFADMQEQEQPDLWRGNPEDFSLMLSPGLFTSNLCDALHNRVFIRFKFQANF